MEYDYFHNEFIYRIDNNDNIIYVSENWNKFAIENDASSSCLSFSVLKNSLWSFFADQETVHLYQILFKKARINNEMIKIPIRCDAPHLKRFIQLTIKPMPYGHLEIISKIIKSEKRDFVRLLDKKERRSDEVLKICSYCKKIAFKRNEWVNIENAVEMLNLFEKSKLPKFTHGVCSSCLKIVMAEIDKL